MNLQVWMNDLTSWRQVEVGDYFEVRTLINYNHQYKHLENWWVDEIKPVKRVVRDLSEWM